MNSLDRDGLDGLWKTGTAPAPSRDALRGVASVRLWGDAGDEYTEEVTSRVDEAQNVTAQFSADAPPPIEFKLPEPPPSLPGERTQWRSLFYGVSVSLLGVGLVLFFSDSEPEPVGSPPVVMLEPAEPAKELSTPPPAAAEEIQFKPAVAEVEAPKDLIGDLIAAQNEPSPIAVEEEPTEAPAEVTAPIHSPVTLAPVESNEIRVEIPDLRRRLDFPGTFSAGGYLPQIDDAKPWDDLVTGLKSSTGPISLVGHTDVDGRHPDDRDTAWLRGDAVRALLIERGLDRDRIAVLSAGDSRPSSNPKATQASNRRVEVLYTASPTD